MTEPNLQALAAFLPIVMDSGFKPGEVVSLPPGNDGVMQMPFVSYGEAVHAFLKAAYAEGWVLSDFGWPDWAGSEEVVRLRDDPARSRGPRPSSSCAFSPSASARTGSRMAPCSMPSSPA